MLKSAVWSVAATSVVKVTVSDVLFVVGRASLFPWFSLLFASPRTCMLRLVRVLISFFLVHDNTFSIIAMDKIIVEGVRS